MTKVPLEKLWRIFCAPWGRRQEKERHLNVCLLPGKASGVLEIGSSSLSPYPSLTLSSHWTNPLGPPPHEWHWAGATDGLTPPTPRKGVPGFSSTPSWQHSDCTFPALWGTHNAAMHHPCFSYFLKRSLAADPGPCGWNCVSLSLGLQGLPGFAEDVWFSQEKRPHFPTPFPTPPVTFQTL